MFIAPFFITAKVRKQLKCPSTDEWIKKTWCIYIYATEYHSAILKKRKEILPFPTPLMNLKGIMLSEISETKKDKYCMLSLIYGL